MSNSQIKFVSKESTHCTEYSNVMTGKTPFHSLLKLKPKGILVEKLKAIGEELLEWLLLMATILVFVHLFSDFNKFRIRARQGLVRMESSSMQPINQNSYFTIQNQPSKLKINETKIK